MKPSRTIAAFDFDGTLTICDTLPVFIRHAIGTRHFLFAMLRTLPWLAAYKSGLYSNSRAKERLFRSCFKGMAADRFRAIAHEFSSTVIPQLLRGDTVATLDQHVADGTTVYIISASIRDWIEPWAQSHGVRAVIATEVHSETDGLLSGHFATPNCHGTEKVSRLLQAEPDRKHYRLIAYGDSQGDAPLLEEADESHWIH